MTTQLPPEALPEHAKPSPEVESLRTVPENPVAAERPREAGPGAAASASRSPSRATHRLIGPAIAAHGVLALALAPLHGTYAAAALGTVLLASIFFFTCRRIPEHAASRHAASLSLGGFAVLHAYQLHGGEAAWLLPYLALVLLVFYEDPRSLWPGAIVVGTARLAGPPLGLPLIAAEAGDGFSLTSIAELAIYFTSALAATAGAILLRTRTRRAIERLRMLATENARITAELEQARERLLEAASTRRKAPAGWSESTAEERDRERRLRQVLESAADAVAVIDVESGRIVDLNPKLIEITGRSQHELAGREHLVLYPASRETFIRTIFRHVAAGTSRTVELELAHRDGQTTAVEAALSLVHSSRERLIVAVLRDITERKQTEARKALLGARHQEMLRLEGLHAMAAGVAHDFNNILMTILGFASIGRDRCTDHSIAQSYFDRIEGATLRAGEVCRQMLTFAGRGQATLRSSDINTVVRELEPALRAKLSPLVELEIASTDNLPEVCVDPALVSKAVGILFTNALEAIGERPGAIHLRTFQVAPDDPVRDEAFLSPQLSRDTYVVIELQDTGAGIAAAALPRVFEPFYSTKSIGRGLGLSEALGVIRAQHGAIQAKSTLGEGSVFRIYLPSAPCRRSSSPLRQAPPSKDPTHRPRNIALVIEDETSVRELVCAMVGELGFTVYRAVDGTEGLALFEQFGPQVGLVLLDLTMPGLPSHRVLEAIRRARQEVQVLIMSGYSEQDVISRCGNSRPDGFLPKPFTVSELRRAIFGHESADALPGR